MCKLIISVGLFLLSIPVLSNDWIKLYGLDEPESLPQYLINQTYEIDGSSMTVAGLYVDLSESLSDVQVGALKPDIIVIVADTLEISDDFVSNLRNQGLFIFARRIVGQGSGNFYLDGGTDSTSFVSVFTDEVSASLNVISFYPDFSFDVDTISASGSDLGETISLRAGQHNRMPINGDITGYFQFNLDAYQSLLNQTFDMAASIYDQNPQLSNDMLTWLGEKLGAAIGLRDANELMANLYLQTMSFKQFVEFSAQSDRYIPYLDRSLYQSTYASYLEVMENYQEQYERFMDLGASNSERKQDAVLIQENLTDVISAEAAIIDNSELTIIQLYDALETINDQFSAQEISVFNARSDFMIGLAQWERKQEFAVALDVFTAVATLGGAVAGAFVGNVDGLNSLAEDLPDTAIELTRLAQKIKAVATVLDNVTKSVNAMASLRNTIKLDIKHDTIKDQFENLSFDIPSLTVSNNNWDTLLIDVQTNLRWASSLGIVGASGYLAELEKLILYGKSINATQISIAQEQSRLIDLIITAEININQIERIGSLIEEIDTDQEALTSLEQNFYRALNAMKRPIYVAVSNYVAAFNYWALDESSVIPSLNKDYLNYRLDLATLENEYTSALNQFTPSPQDFNITSVRITDTQQLTAFITNGELSVPIALEHDAFSLFERVRLDTIRVILEGDDLPQYTDIYLDIQSNGEYQDRFEDIDYTFNSNPLYRLFGYQYQEESVSIIIDGSVSDRFEFAYFEPTPFSTWSIRLYNHESFDLTNISAIRIEFSGNAIPIN